MDLGYDVVEFSSTEQTAAVLADSGPGNVPLYVYSKLGTTLAL